MLIKCNHLTLVWTRVISYLKQQESSNILELKPENLIMNNVHPQSTHLINTQVLVLKQLIFQNKCLNEATTFNEFLRELSIVEQNERYIASKVGKVATHNEKWISLKRQQTNLSDFVHNYITNM